MAWYQEQPCGIPHFWRGRQRQYYPDALVGMADGRGVLVEVKPRFEMAMAQNLAKWEATTAFCRERGLGFLVTDLHTPIQKLFKAQVAVDYRDSIVSALARGPLSWHEYRRVAPGRVVMDLAALVLQERLTWSLGPFCLRTGSEANGFLSSLARGRL